MIIVDIKMLIFFLSENSGTELVETPSESKRGSSNFIKQRFRQYLITGWDNNSVR